MRVYLAGPMTGIKDFNRPAFDDAAKKLRLLGYDIINPARTWLPEGADSWQDYMRVTTRQLTQCDAVALLPGWEKSTGAQIERRWAEAVGLVVLPLDQWKAPRRFNDSPPDHPTAAFRRFREARG